VYDYLDGVRSSIASSVGAEAEDVVIIENASEGMNAILKSLVSPGSAVLYLADLEYFMVAETLRYLHDTIGAVLVGVTTAALFPVPDADGSEGAFEDGLVALVEAALDAALDTLTPVALCSFSHISSMPSVVLPVTRLASACKARGAKVAIDGAHVLGNIALDVPSIG
jgi:isopenicillin-N epimerase